MLLRWIAPFALTLVVAQLIESQPLACSYSCPDADAAGQPLLKRMLAIPYVSDYSIFECVYGEVNPNPKTRSCFYRKVDGMHALGYEGDGCSTEALPCSADEAEQGHFSSPGNPEVPAWIQNGRNLLYYKENHP
ncbi:hypothetical protein NP233_g11491 [Leucocoprinus birnbaumii]|uniref:Uncharacterized protein n=1 Tax=Leucocoprinus birnbaumii TaxID=56174 RepID=A0AAD5VHD1_9AGAR|nr:hypothetical protein NP233_g11491 [Leucocoprinus birnbaumii]